MRVPVGLPRKRQSSSVTLVGISKMEGPRLTPSSPSLGTRRLRLRASLISRWTRLSRRLTSVIMEETVSRREVSVVRTDLRSSSRVVAGAAATSATAATGAAATGTETEAEAAATGATAAGAAALRAAVFLTSATGAAGAGAGAATGATAAGATSSVFLATRLGLAAEEVEAEFIILVPVEEFISIKRTIPTYMDGMRINFHSKPFNFGNRAHTENFFSLNGPGG